MIHSSRKLTILVASLQSLLLLAPPALHFLGSSSPSPSAHHHLSCHAFHPVLHRNQRQTVISTNMVLTTPESIIEQASTQSLLDDLIDESVRTSARRPIMMQFDPSSGWIWKRWKGTIFSETWDSCVSKMIYASIVFFICKSYPGIKEWLSGFNVLWGQLLSVTTFTLTFFVNQSYALWRKCYELSRRLQGRLHDLDMTLAAHAARKPPSSPNEPSTYTPGSRQVLELVSRYVRLFNLLTYASFTRSHRPILTPRGMRRLVERGLMTSQEREVLGDAEIPATQRHNAVLLWIMRAFIEGREAGHFHGGAGFEEQFLEKIHVCRAQYGGIGDELQGRMPLAYAHIVQVLVDMILWMYPFMAFSSGMSGLLSVFGTGLLTVSYQGLFDLAKQFLDPYDNESYGKGEDPLVVDTLIAETNAGSVRWMYGLEEFPVSAQRIKDGELSDYLLPLRGFSVEELEQMEEERLQKEREMMERREREEEERRRAEEQEHKVQEAAKAMMDAKFTQSTVDRLANTTYVAVRNGAVAKPESLPILYTAKPSDLNYVTEFLDIMPNLCEEDLEDFVPEGTAPSVPMEPDVYCLDEEEDDMEEEEDDDDDDEEPTLFGGITKQEIQDEDDDDAFEVIQDWGVNGDDAPYVHTFDAFDPYGDLPWFEEIGPDGKEIRLSQLLADEEWEEELEARREKEMSKVLTLEEYAKRAAEIINATQSELRETQEIMLEAPGSQSSSLPIRDQSDGALKYDQTKLDGLSQLWGLPPNELSEIPGYREPPLTSENDLSGIAQLWGESFDSDRIPASFSSTKDDQGSDSFGGISQLWGTDLDGQGDEPSSFAKADSSVDPFTGTRKIRREEKDDYRPTGGSIETGEARLSQMLANEEWEEEQAATSLETPVTFEDYKRQVRDILEAEREELLETAAILNAPPGADNLEVPGEGEKPSLIVANSTESKDDLAILEMDEPVDEVTQPVRLPPLDSSSMARSIAALRILQDDDDSSAAARAETPPFGDSDQTELGESDDSEDESSEPAPNGES